MCVCGDCSFFYKMILYLTSERRASLPYWRASVSADRDSHRGARAQDLVPRTQLPLRQAEALGGVSAPQRLEAHARHVHGMGCSMHGARYARLTWRVRSIYALHMHGICTARAHAQRRLEPRAARQAAAAREGEQLPVELEAHARGAVWAAGRRAVVWRQP